MTQMLEVLIEHGFRGEEGDDSIVQGVQQGTGV